MVLNEWAYRLKHIPGSLNIYLTMHGYDNVRRYAGGVTDWEERGYPFESEGVE